MLTNNEETSTPPERSIINSFSRATSHERSSVANFYLKKNLNNVL